MQLYNVGRAPQEQDKLGNLQGQDELTRPSWNVQFNKERDRQVIKFNEKLTSHQPFSNIE
jgi:hypothetical protein